MFLKKLTLENFKSHKNTTIEFGKVTVLIGHNNSGKSSILQSLIMLSQSVKNGQNRLLTRNDVLDLGEYSDIANSANTSKPLSINLEFSEKILLGAIDGNYIDSEFANIFYSVSFKEQNITQVNFNVHSQHTDVSYISKPPKSATGYVRRKFDDFTCEFLINSEGLIPQFQITGAAQHISQAFNKDFQGDLLRNIFLKFYYIPFQRTIGEFGPVLTARADISQIVSRNPASTSSRLLSTLAKDPKLWHKVSQLFSSVYNENAMPQNLDPDFYDQANKDSHRITLQFQKGIYSSSLANEGGGINQLVLLFTILTGSPTNSLICLDEPEIHLHPAKQSILIKNILNILKKDEKQLVLTTHSEHILYPLLSAVSKGELSPKDLSIYYFQLDETKHESSFEKLEVNEYGQVKGGLKGFWDATSDAMSDFVRDDNA